MKIYRPGDSGYGSVAQAEPPSTGWATCDTKKCIAYLESVEAKSKALTDLWTEKSNKYSALSGKTGGLSPDKEEDFLSDQKVWNNAKRLPWLKSLPSKIDDCDSTFPGPCKEAIAYAAQHEGDIVTWEHKLSTYTGVKTSISDAPPVRPKEEKGNGGWSWPSLSMSPITKLLVAAGIGTAAYIAIKR